jgi:hypothetical protein
MSHFAEFQPKLFLVYSPSFRNPAYFMGAAALKNP